MKRIHLTGLLIVTTSFLLAQEIDAIINTSEVERIERVLSADEMRGRKTFTPEIDKAADFIASEFKAIGLETLGNSGSYRQEFVRVRPRLISASVIIDGVHMDPKNMIVVSCQPELKLDQHSGYELAVIKTGSNLRKEASGLARANKNRVVMVDQSYASEFQRLTSLNRSLFKTDKNVVFILNNTLPVTFAVEARQEITEQKMANIVGVIPGRSRIDEQVIFSGHYDHLGVGKPVEDDSIFNGANDNAAGVTAVIMLAKYFKQVKNNERTIVFVAFTAEEMGGYGSQFFSRQIDTDKMAAMFNIEMIGTESKWGKNSAYITGYEKTDMGKILQKNLEGTGFEFYPDPYTAENLFYRSDNASLALLGVPAHTISTAKMENEPHYHKVSDEIKTLDLENMAKIIQSIALSAKTIISGKESPSRVKSEELR